jgi:hypothetical protein
MFNGQTSALFIDDKFSISTALKWTNNSRTTDLAHMGVETDGMGNVKGGRRSRHTMSAIVCGLDVTL